MDTPNLIQKLSVLFSYEIQQKWKERNMILSLEVNHISEQVAITVFAAENSGITWHQKDVIVTFTMFDHSEHPDFIINPQSDFEDDVLDGILYNHLHSKEKLKELGKWPAVAVKSIDDFITRMCR